MPAGFQVSSRRESSRLRSFASSALAAEADPYIASVVSLLHFDGADTSTTFTDQRSHSWSANGVAQIDTGLSVYGGASGQVTGGTGSILSAASADWDLGTGEFCMEAWIYTTASGGCPMMNNQTSSNKVVALFYDTTTSARVILNGSNALTGITCPASTWFHYALERAGTTLTAYVDGVSAASATYSSAIGSNGQIFLLGSTTHTGWRGNMDDYRLTKGTARYRGNFTPPPSPHPDP